MEQFGTSGTASRFTKYRTLLVALGVILVGGAVFAATDGGSSVLKNLFVFITIDGEVTELELQAIDGDATWVDGDATWVMENDDGGTTTINLYQLDELEGDGVQTVDIVIEADGAGDKTIDLLLDGLPADGTIHIAAGDPGAQLGADGGDNVEVIELIGDPDDDHERRQTMIDELLSREADGATNVEVQLGGDGMATITLTFEDGTERVLTLDVSAETEDGELTVDDDGEVTIQKTAAESDE